MGPQKPKTRRHFTDAARAAAIEARRRKREAAIPLTTPTVFVVRLADAHLSFGWEIRRFGAVVLDRSSTAYLTVQRAHSAGESALAGRRIEA